MDPLDRPLIRELLGIALDSRSGVNAKEFRARHEDHLDALNRLERGPYIEKKDNLYRIKLPALAEFKCEDAKIETLLRQCDQVFRLLRANYKNCLDAPVALAEISIPIFPNSMFINPILVRLVDFKLVPVFIVGEVLTETRLSSSGWT